MTLLLNGTITLSAEAVALLGMPAPERVAIVYDPADRALGIRPTRPDDVTPQTRRLARIPNGRSYKISAMTLAAALGLTDDELPARAVATLEDGLLIAVFPRSED